MNILISTFNPHHGDTYFARAREWDTKASSTAGREAAVRACARKIAKGRPFTIQHTTFDTWLCEIDSAE